jgi:hypothetical protein
MRPILPLVLLLLACSPAVTPPPPPPLVPDAPATDLPTPPHQPPPPDTPPAAPAAPYTEVLTGLAVTRQALAGEYAAAAPSGRHAILARARATALAAIRDDIIPRWYGTPWDFYGTTEIPGEGVIACGYFVSTVLRDAGFCVERVTLAQQPSEFIVKTFATEDAIWRYRSRAASVVSDEVRSHGDGLYAVGLDIHTGLIVVDGDRVDFCHSSFLDPVAVVCEPVRNSPGFASDYRIVGKLLSDEMLLAWLQQTPIRTHPYGEMGL